jgi:hypothetical protein
MKSLFLRPFKMGLVTLLLSTSFLVSSCGGGGGGKNVKIEGVVGPNLLVVDDGLLVTMVFQKIVMDGGLRYEIPEYQESYVEVGPDLQSGGTLMAIYISFLDVFDNAGYLKSLDPQTLPGGRPIPGLASGALPAVAFSIPEFHNVSFYLGNNIYALFVPVDIGIKNAIATFRFYSDGARVGNISLVGEDNSGENAGVLLALDLGSKAAKMVKKMAKK